MRSLRLWLLLALAVVGFYPLVQLCMFALAAVAGAILLTMPAWGLWLFWKLATSRPDPEAVAHRKRIEERLEARRRGEDLLGIPHRPTLAEAARTDAWLEETDRMLRL